MATAPLVIAGRISWRYTRAVWPGERNWVEPLTLACKARLRSRMPSLACAGYFRLSAAVQSDGIRLLRLPDWDGEVLVRRVVLTLSALTATGLVLTACGERSRPSPWADPPIPTIPQKVEGGQAITRSGR